MSLTKLGSRFNLLRLWGMRALSHQTTFIQSSNQSQSNTGVLESSDSQFGNRTHYDLPKQNYGAVPRPPIGENISRNDKVSFLVNTLHELDDSKEATYSALDAWVAWERNFPIGLLKMVLIALEKEKHWHKIIQVIKWMLSKGQGTTMGTYKQLIFALDMDHRAKEAHEFWLRKIAYEFHSVPWELCKLMISVYYRNNMLEELINLFKELEAFDRKLPDKSVVQKVADAYDVLGFIEEKERVLAKYEELFTQKSQKAKGLPAHKRRQARERT
ncbi:OLC1v1014491C3 [Oldenlandia corymbosa var. corymbosa]|nr:OLC1v1014491C3 [Oldenlandia corymbosa var. corymbosa]